MVLPKSTVIEGVFGMTSYSNDLRADFIEALKEVSTLMSIAYERSALSGMITR